MIVVLLLGLIRCAIVAALVSGVLYAYDLPAKPLAVFGLLVAFELMRAQIALTVVRTESGPGLK